MFGDWPNNYIKVIKGEAYSGKLSKSVPFFGMLFLKIDSEKVQKWFTKTGAMSFH